MPVISASRRTDIPAFYTPWLLARLRAGLCHVDSPYGGGVRRVDLRPEAVRALVLWTRNPAPLLPHLDALAAYPSYAMVTITGYPRALEPAAPTEADAVAAFRRLAEAWGPSRVHWRYDPVLLSAETPAAVHRANVARLAAALAGHTARCIVSFTDFYAKTRRNLAGVAYTDPDADARSALAAELAEIAAGHGIAMHACCEAGLPLPGAHCVDASLIAALSPGAALATAPSRAGCGCAASVDIGAYDTCAHGCRYCYATSAPAAALRRRAEHDPADTILWRSPRLRGVAL
jgi:hypothetical protein